MGKLDRLTPFEAFAWCFTPLPYATAQSILFGRASTIGRSRSYAVCDSVTTFAPAVLETFELRRTKLRAGSILALLGRAYIYEAADDILRIFILGRIRS